jgi:hypothetical protein
MSQGAWIWAVRRQFWRAVNEPQLEGEQEGLVGAVVFGL